MINRILKKCFCFPRFTVCKCHHSQGLRWEACVHWGNVWGRDLLCGKLFQKQPVCLRNRRRNRVPSSQGQVMLRVSEVRWDPVTAHGGQGSHLSGFTFPSTMCRSKCFYSKVLPCGVLFQNLEKKLISYFLSKVLMLLILALSTHPRHLLFCRVTLGKSFLQFSAMKMAHSPPGHHSVTGRPSVNGLALAEYVIYRGEQVVQQQAPELAFSAHFNGLMR